MMSPALVVTLSLLGAGAVGTPDAGIPKPAVEKVTAADFERTPPNLARVHFRLGNLQKAIDIARKCERTHPKECKTLKVAIVEYQALAHDASTLTQKNAKAFLEWDEKISPGDPGRLTVPVIARWVKGPLREAAMANAAGNLPRARELVRSVLEVRPKDAEAKAMWQQLAVDAGQ